MAVVRDWVSGREQERALLMAADLVTRFGKRHHMELLQRHKSADSQFGREVIQEHGFQIAPASLD